MPMPSLADVIERSMEHGRPLGLVEGVALAREAGASQHITVETVFTTGPNPLLGIEPRNIAFTQHSLGSMTLMNLRDSDGDWFLASFPTQYESVFHIVTDAHSTDSRWRKANRWITRSRRVTRVYLNHADFLSIAIALSEFGDVEVGRITARSTEDGSSATRGWGARSGHARPSPDTAIAELSDQGQSVRTMTIHVPGALSMHLRRTAGATFYSGDFAIFCDQVLRALARAVSSRHQLLSHRERRAHSPVVPLSLALDGDYFSDMSSTGDLIQAVAELPRTTLAIFHRNPYLHFAATDEVDGSTFDVVVTDADRIDIYPGFRAEPTSIARLADHLADRFGASSLGGRPARSWTLADVTGD